jgi:hypothetical protein
MASTSGAGRPATTKGPATMPERQPEPSVRRTFSPASITTPSDRRAGMPLARIRAVCAGPAAEAAADVAAWWAEADAGQRRTTSVVVADVADSRRG